MKGKPMRINGIEITGDEIYEALTRPVKAWSDERELNEAGHKLASMITDEVLRQIRQKLGEPEAQ